MICIKCGSKTLKTTNSRSTKNGLQTWRRKQCQTCKTVFSSYEKANLSAVISVTSKSKPLPYNRYILAKSILESFDQTELDKVNIDALLDTIELKFVRMSKPTLSSDEVATTTLKTLKPVNLGAYMRYLSNHTKLSTASQLKKLL